MTFTIAAAIVTISLLFIILKYFEKFDIDNFQGLTVNYATAGICYYLYSNSALSELKNYASQYFPFYIMMGCLFISVFYITALSSQQNGVSVATIASKMSVVIPVLAGVALYGENFHFLKILGLILAVLSVYLTSTGDQAAVKNKILLPTLVFIGAGMVDSSIKYVQHIVHVGTAGFFSLVFFTAFTAGVLITLFRYSKYSIKLKLKNIAGGIILGVCNFASLFYMIGALEENNKDSGTVYITVNCGVVLCSVLLSALLFREKLTYRGITGVVIALSAIFVLS